MGRKRSLASPCASSSKRQRRSIDLELKRKIIQLYEDGRTVNNIARDLNMSHSTITTILKNKEKIMRAVQGTAALTSTRLTKMREGPISEMEKLLMTWIEEQTQKRIPLTMMKITAKAKSLFEMLKENAGEDYKVEFSASSGWFRRFKKRYSLQKIKLNGEPASADDTEDKFIGLIAKLSKDDGCLAKPVFKECVNGLWMQTLNVTHLAAKLNLQVAPDDTEEFLNVEPDELTYEELLERQECNKKEIKKETVDEEPVVMKKLSVQGLAKAFADLNNVLNSFKDIDPDSERFATIEREVLAAFAPYKILYENQKKEKQSNLDRIVERITPSQDEPKPGPSGITTTLKCKMRTAAAQRYSDFDGDDSDTG